MLGARVNLPPIRGKVAEGRKGVLHPDASIGEFIRLNQYLLFEIFEKIHDLA